MNRHRLALIVAAAVMAFTVSPALAQPPPAGAQGQASTPPPKVTFNDEDRQATKQWFETHQKNLPPGLKPGDRLPPDLEQQLREGLVLDRILVKQVKPVPPTLLHLLAPPPGVYRYAIVGWHLVLIDDSYRVKDVIHINHR